MKQLMTVLSAVACAATLAGCTFNIQPVVPNISMPAQAGTNVLPCAAELLVPEAFRQKEYVSSFNNRKITIAVGPPATKTIYRLAKSRFASVTKASVPGDGTVAFVRKASAVPTGTVVLRPRFVQTSSSTHGITYEVQFAIALDAASSGASTSAVGRGAGEAHFYVKSALQSAANTALAGAMTSLATQFHPSCPAGQRRG